MTPENIDNVHDIVLADRRVRVCELAEAVGISIDRVYFILHHEKSMGTMGAAFAHSRTRTKSHGNI